MRFCTAVWWRWKSRPPPYSASWSWDGPGCQQSPLPSPRWSQSPSKNTVFNDIKVYVRIITSVFQDGNIITVHRWLIFMYLHHFISTDAAVTIDIIEVKRPDNLRRKILIEKFFVRRKKFRLSKLPPSFADTIPPSCHTNKQCCDRNSNLIPLRPFAYNREEVHEVSESDSSWVMTMLILVMIVTMRMMVTTPFLKLKKELPVLSLSIVLKTRCAYLADSPNGNSDW